MASIAIYGGTFDPIHYGHLRSVAELKARLDLTEVRLIPAHIPPHRDRPGATSVQRLDMLKLALQEFPQLGYDAREMERSGASYTIDTLSEIRAEVGSDTSLVFVLGADAYVLLHEWHRWREITDYANVVIMQRPGAEHLRADHIVLEWQRQRWVEKPELFLGHSGQISEVRLTPHDVSATQIRNYRASNQSIEALVPRSVAAYITQHGLYQD